MPTDKPIGRLLVTRRAMIDMIRSATLGSYGVAGFSGTVVDRILGRIGLASPGIRLLRRDDGLHVELDLGVSPGLPIAEVARQVDSAVRHAIRRGTGMELAGVRIRVDLVHVAVEAGDGARRPPSEEPDPASGVTTEEMAASGTDVA